MKHQHVPHLLEQIQEVSRRLSRGADLPELATALDALGVSHCHTYLADGSTCYFGPAFYRVEGAAAWRWVTVSETASPGLLKEAIALHLEGVTDQITFLRQAADAGVEVFTLSVTSRTVTYMDRDGSVMAVEPILSREARLN